MLFDGLVRMFGGASDSPRPVRDAPCRLLDHLAAIQGARVLLVEDNDINQEVATELLCDAGFIVDLAEDGQIAVNKVGTSAYDIVLMDMQLPVMDGVSATREIRKEARFKELPIVAMTANAMQVDRERCLAALQRSLEVDRGVLTRGSPPACWSLQGLGGSVISLVGRHLGGS